MIHIPPHTLRHTRLHFQQHHHLPFISTFLTSPSARFSTSVPAQRGTGAALEPIGSIRRFRLPVLGGGVATGAQTARAASTLAGGWNVMSSDSDTDGSEPEPSRSRGPVKWLDPEAGVGRWTGRAVFVATSPSPAPQSPPRASASQHGSGSAVFPIDITSSPSASSSSSHPSPEARRAPSTPLSRPRAVPAYSSPISRTAYTPPRAFFPPSPARQMSSPAGPAVHPFFNRTFGRSKSTPVPHTPPPPASQRPRMVANYSSTSESQASTATGADSTFGSQPRKLARAAERSSQPSPSARTGSNLSQGAHQRPGARQAQGKGKGRATLSEREIDDLVAGVKTVDLTGKFKPNPMDAPGGYGGRGKAPAKPAQQTWPGPKAGAPAGKAGGARVSSGGSASSGSGTAKNGALARYGRPTAPNGATAQKAPEAKKSGKPAVSSSANGSMPPYPLPSIPKSTTSARPPAKAAPKTAVPVSSDHVNYFQYSDYFPAPEVVYTTNFAEADALLSRLEGKVLGLDLEWPQAGFYKPPGGGPKKPIGMTWNAAQNKWDFGQGRTALIQVCDEKLIVLIHLKEGNNMKLPQKVIDIMQSREIYKCGVQVQGDGLKLKRDFPDSFPKGVNALLELTKVARRVDPVGTGPGSALIGLTKLTEAYTGKPLDKESKVRRSNWLFDLDDKQVQYAANDVYAGLKVYLELQRLADERQIHVDLDKCSSAYNPDGSSRAAPTYLFPNPAPPLATSSTAGTPIPPTDMRLAPGQFKYPPPRQQNVLNQFRAGTTLAAFATAAQIQPATAQGYMCDALAVLADDTLTPEEMGRLVPQLKDIRIRRKHKALIVKLKRGAGEVVSDSDGSVVELEEEVESDREVQAGSGKAVDDIEEQMGRVTLDSRPEMVLEAKVEATVADHGWTAEELEAASMMSDSDEEYAAPRK